MATANRKAEGFPEFPEEYLKDRSKWVHRTEDHPWTPLVTFVEGMPTGKGVVFHYSRESWIAEYVRLRMLHHDKAKCAWFDFDNRYKCWVYIGEDRRHDDND